MVPQLPTARAANAANELPATGAAEAQDTAAAADTALNVADTQQARVEAAAAQARQQLLPDIDAATTDRVGDVQMSTAAPLLGAASELSTAVAQHRRRVLRQASSMGSAAHFRRLQEVDTLQALTTQAVAKVQALADMPEAFKAAVAQVRAQFSDATTEAVEALQTAGSQGEAELKKKFDAAAAALGQVRSSISAAAMADAKELDGDGQDTSAALSAIAAADSHMRLLHDGMTKVLTKWASDAKQGFGTTILDNMVATAAQWHQQAADNSQRLWQLVNSTNAAQKLLAGLAEEGSEVADSLTSVAAALRLRIMDNAKSWVASFSSNTQTAFWSEALGEVRHLLLEGVSEASDAVGQVLPQLASALQGAQPELQGTLDDLRAHATVVHSSCLQPLHSSVDDLLASAHASTVVSLLGDSMRRHSEDCGVAFDDLVSSVGRVVAMVPAAGQEQEGEVGDAAAMVLALHDAAATARAAVLDKLALVAVHVRSNFAVDVAAAVVDRVDAALSLAASTAATAHNHYAAVATLLPRAHEAVTVPASVLTSIEGIADGYTGLVAALQALDEAVAAGLEQTQAAGEEATEELHNAVLPAPVRNVEAVLRAIARDVATARAVVGGSQGTRVDDVMTQLWRDFSQGLGSVRGAAGGALRALRSAARTGAEVVAQVDKVASDAARWLGDVTHGPLSTARDVTLFISNELRKFMTLGEGLRAFVERTRVTIDTFGQELLESIRKQLTKVINDVMDPFIGGVVNASKLLGGMAEDVVDEIAQLLRSHTPSELIKTIQDVIAKFKPVLLEMKGIMAEFKGQAAEFQSKAG